MFLGCQAKSPNTNLPYLTSTCYQLFFVKFFFVRAGKSDLNENFKKVHIISLKSIFSKFWYESGKNDYTTLISIKNWTRWNKKICPKFFFRNLKWGSSTFFADYAMSCTYFFKFFCGNGRRSVQIQISLSLRQLFINFFL